MLRSLVSALLASTFASGCISVGCDRDGDAPQRYSDGNTNAEGSFYETSGLDGPFLYFPPGRVYRLEHGLSETPADFDVDLSFDERPLSSGVGFAENAGNQANFEAINDEYIEVRNDTCAEVFIRVTARVAPFASSTLDDAGADGG